MAKPRLLVAVTRMGYEHVRRALHGCFDLVDVFTVHQARTALEVRDVDGILCSIHFDESRMFDLLHEAQNIMGDVPVVCCRILYSPLSQQAIDGLVTTAKSLGCRGYVDYNDLHRTHGLGEADRRFCEAVVDLLGMPDVRKNCATGS